MEGTKWENDNRASTLVQPASTVAHAHAAIFPKLKILGLTELNFSDGVNTTSTLFDFFERGLKQRMAASGAPLKSLRLSNCDISTEHANDLKKLVQDLDWDGSEGINDIFECLDAYEQHLCATPEFGFVGHGPALRDWDSDGWDDYTDGDNYGSSDGRWM
jgi:hypothetical protein